MEQAIDVVRCKRLEVVDDNGVVRATLGTVDRGDFAAVLLGLCAPDGKEHLVLHCESVTAGVELWERGNIVASLGSIRAGHAGLALNDAATGSPLASVKNDPVPFGWTEPLPFYFQSRLFPWLRLKGRLVAEKE